jgi:hypothetical protein
MAASPVPKTSGGTHQREARLAVVAGVTRLSLETFAGAGDGCLGGTFVGKFMRQNDNPANLKMIYDRPR